MRLHYLPGSAAMAPHAALAEIGVPYELARVERDAQGRSPAAYLALNPSGRVPTLEDGPLVLTESAAIVLHLADRFPDAGLLPPAGTVARSDCVRWLVFQTNTMQTGLLRLMYPERYGTAGVAERAAIELRELFDRVDTHLAEHEWLVGDTRTGADLYLFMLTRWGRHLDPQAWSRPGIGAHFERCRALAGVTRMLEEQGIEARPM